MDHFLSINDLSQQELLSLIDNAAELKKQPIQSLLKNQTLGMIFEKTSTRTRVSFEVGMFQLGGHALFLSKNDIQLGHGETIADTARVLSRYLNFIAVRVYAHQTLEELAAHASVPVINMLSDLEHPCQIVADLFTMSEHLGELKGKRVAWIGDGNNVCHSLLLGSSLLGMDIAVATPAKYAPDSAIVAQAQKNAKKSGSSVLVTTDPIAAAREADVVYNDTFISMALFLWEKRERKSNV